MFIVISSGSFDKLLFGGKKPNKKKNKSENKRKKVVQPALKKKSLSMKERFDIFSAIITPFSLLIGILKTIYEIFGK